MQIQLVVGRADERLGEIHRIADDRRHREDVAVQHPVLGERRLIAARQTVAAHVPFFQVRRLHREHVAVPASGRESRPRVRRVRRWMGTSVHVDLTIDRSQPLGVPRDHLTRHRIDVLPHPQRRRAAPDVVRRMRTALPFGQRLNRRFPRRRAHPRGVVDRNAEVVAKFRSGHTLRFVFVKARRPFAGEVDACGRGARDLVGVLDE